MNRNGVTAQPHFGAPVAERARIRVKRGIDRDCWVCGNPDWRWRGEGKRKDAQTCSNACRQRGYRLRLLARAAMINANPGLMGVPPDHPIWDAAARRIQRTLREQG